MMNRVLECLDRKEVRQRILEVYTEDHAENWQKNGTPGWVAHDMVGLIKDSPELVYVVLFNHEFLEELVFERGITRERIIFMADCADEGVLATGVYGVRTMVLPQEIKDPKKAIEFVKEKLCKVLYEGGPMPKTNNLVVFGNPPYQEQSEAQKKRTGGKSQAKAIYHLFVEAILDVLNPKYLSFITPSRWMAGGMGLGKFRKRMMNDRRLEKITHFPGQSDVFKDNIVKGGVSYFLWNRDHNSKCEFNGVHRNLNEYDIILSDSKAVSVLDKVLASHKSRRFLDRLVLPAKPFGVATNFSDWKPAGTKCYSRNQEEHFVDPNAFSDDAGILNHWKICTSKGTNPDKEGNFHKFNSIFLAEPGSVCTETYIVAGSFPQKQEAENYLAYMGTKFYRFMLSLRMNTQDLTRERFSWVPDLGNYTTAPTDEQLFKMFGLTENEVAYIKSRVK